MPIPDHDHTRAIWTALFVTMLWSSSWVLIRIVLDDESLSPIAFAGLRYAVAAALLVGWCSTKPAHRRQLVELDRATLKRLAILGLVFVTLTQGAQFVAIDNQPAATTSLVWSLTAFAVAMLSVRSLGEQTTARQLGGTALVAAGAALYFAGDLGASSLGMAASLIGLTANVAGSLLGRSINRNHRLAPTVVTTVSMGIGATLLLLAGLALEGPPDITFKAAAIIAWLAVVNTALAFTLWNKSLRHLTAVESAAINNTMLVQIAGLAWLFLGERPGVFDTFGIVVVSLGVYLSQPALNRSRQLTLDPSRAL